MVKIIQLPTDKTIDELFEPKDKYAMLMVGKDFYTGYAIGVPDFQRWHPHVSGNLFIYDWELAMTRRVDTGEHCPLNRLDEIVGSIEGENNILIPLRAGDLVRLALGGKTSSYKGSKIEGVYKEVIKVWPGTVEVIPEFKAGVKRFADLSDDQTLTSVIIFSHGDKGMIQMGSAWMRYTDFLKELDKIKGKKTVFVYACNSGSFLRTLKQHDKKRDYAAIASSEADNESTNWTDQSLDAYLLRHFSSGRRFSDLELEPLGSSFHTQQPKILRYFDCSLI